MVNCKRTIAYTNLMVLCEFYTRTTTLNVKLPALQNGSVLLLMVYQFTETYVAQISFLIP